MDYWNKIINNWNNMYKWNKNKLNNYMKRSIKYKQNWKKKLIKIGIMIIKIGIVIRITKYIMKYREYNIANYHIISINNNRV